MGPLLFKKVCYFFLSHHKRTNANLHLIDVNLAIDDQLRIKFFCDATWHRTHLSTKVGLWRFGILILAIRRCFT